MSWTEIEYWCSKFNEWAYRVGDKCDKGKCDNCNFKQDKKIIYQHEQ
jgi:hypothetical protein